MSDDVLWSRAYEAGKDEARDELRQLREELRQAREIIWCMARQNGGKFELHVSSLMSFGPGCSIEIMPTYGAMTMNIIARGANEAERDG